MGDFSSSLGTLLRLVHSGRAQLARTQGFEPGGNYLLGKLLANGDLRSTELAQIACVDNAVVSRQLHSLTDSGLIERVPDPKDGRASLLHITEKGIELFERNNQIQSRFFDGVLAAWSNEDREKFEELLNRFVNDFSRELQLVNEKQEQLLHHE